MVSYPVKKHCQFFTEKNCQPFADKAKQMYRINKGETKL